MVLAHAPRYSNAQQLLEEQHHVPVELGRAFHVATLPRLLDQHRHSPTGHEALPLQVPLVTHHQDGHLTAAAFPAGTGGKNIHILCKHIETDSTPQLLR